MNLVQVHYHCRIGGVRTVMEQYADAAAKSGARVNWIVCSPEKGVKPASGVLKPVADCGYHRFRSRRVFDRMAGRIETALSRLIDQALGAGTVNVVIHNPNLGKNTALTAALGRIVRKKRFSCATFVYVIHDLAEEGRLALHEELIRDLSWEERFPRAPNLYYLAINPVIARALSALGLTVRSFPNPVSLPPTVIRRRASRSGHPLFLHPGRVISRKNPAEAVFVACILGGGELIFGAPGTSARDRRETEWLSRFCRHHSLKVRFNGYSSTVGSTDSLEAWYGRADYCLSTSVAEGFGYALYEPWLRRVPVIGRRPAMFRPLPGTSFHHLYTRLLFPAERLGTAALVSWQERIDTVMDRASFSGKGAVRKALLANGGRYIDFGFLPFVLQLGLMEGVIREGPKAMGAIGAEWGRRVLPMDMAGLTLRARRVCRINRTVIERELSQARFFRNMDRLYSLPRGRLSAGRTGRERVLAGLLNPGLIFRSAG